jgi:predicted DNA-binding protein (MmcQ/YjbR family)
MDERHWITLRPDGELDAGLVENLVTESYLDHSLPNSQRPVEPMTFGQRS